MWFPQQGFSYDPNAKPQAKMYENVRSWLKNKSRKVQNIERTKPDIIAAGNIGCITQIASGTDIPIIHTVELLNWAYGGQKPAGLD